MEQARYERYVAPLDQPQPPEAIRLLHAHKFGGAEIRGFAKARSRSQPGPVAATFLRVRATGSSPAMPCPALCQWDVFRDWKSFQR